MYGHVLILHVANEHVCLFGVCVDFLRLLQGWMIGGSFNKSMDDDDDVTSGTDIDWPTTDRDFAELPAIAPSLIRICSATKTVSSKVVREIRDQIDMEYKQGKIGGSVDLEAMSRLQEADVRLLNKLCCIIYILHVPDIINSKNQINSVDYR